ncbi:RNA polymerase sigma factor [Planctomycetes bacterium Poly30]|uniref:RNA polymerase sigma factor n=1 Tax=Saltatorellus ferox TaxID=2528018 RepID=A0A518ELV4_9BACT|nr:RNA polymerase sigma factor [Planctomycetes bacterium Poly30]
MEPQPRSRRSRSAVNLDELLQHAEWLRGLSRSLVRDGNEAEDVFQESMQVALARLDRAGEAGEAGTAGAIGRPWLAGVARMVTRARQRRAAESARRNAVAVRESNRAATTGSPLDDLEVLDQQRSLIEHVGALPDVQRRVILARFYEGLAPHEIAVQTGANVATVKSQIQRGLAALRERLDGEYGDRRSWAVALLPLAKASELQALKASAVAGSAIAMWTKVAAAILLALGLGILWKETRLESTHAARLVPLGASTEKVDDDPGPVAMEIAAAAGERVPQEAATDRATPDDEAPSRASAHGSLDPVSVAPLSPSAASGEFGDLIVRCVQEGSSLPAPDVYVGLRASADQPDGSYPRGQRSGADGVARWDGIPAGPYFARTQRVEVAAGVATEMLIEVPWRAMIRGRVVDWSGQPVVGAMVAELEGARDVTDAEGRFELHVVPHTAWVKATADGFQHSDVAVVSADVRTKRDVLLTMRRGGASLSGTVLAPDGAAVAGIHVRADETERYRDEHRRDYNLSTMGCTTDSAGRYRFDGLLPVPLRVSVRSGPFGSFERTVDIEQDAVETLDISLPAALELFGKVTDASGEPVAGATVSVYTGRPGVMQSMETDAAGDYRFESAPSGAREFRVGHLEAGSVRVTPTLPASGAHRVDFTLPGTVGDTRQALRGQVLDAAGVPLEKWTVLASSPEGMATIGYTDAEGRFESRREGRWMKDLSVLSPRIYGRVVQSFPDLALANSPVVLGVTTRMGSIRGSVEDRSGGLPEDAQAQLHTLNGPYVQSALSTAAPNFEWSELPPGEYQIRIAGTGRATRKIPVKLDPGQNLDLGTLVSSAGGQLELRGLPAGVPSFVLVSDRAGVVSDPIELRPGQSTLSSLREGPVFVNSMTPGRATRSFEALIEPGQVTVHRCDETPGYVHRVAVTVNGLSPQSTSQGAVLVGYSVEDAASGEVVASFLQVAMGADMELAPLAPGAYRIRAFTHEGYRGSTLIHVMENGTNGPTPLDLRLPGL